MDNFEQESYLVWNKGIFYGLIYSVSYSGTTATYTFYTDFKAGKTAGDNQLAADFKTLTNAPVTDRDIAGAFIESLSKKIWVDVKSGKQEYVECMKTLPKGFFTEANVEHVVDKVIKTTLEYNQERAKKKLKPDEEITKRSDTACCDLMEYAHTQNAHVRKGTGRDLIGVGE